MVSTTSMTLAALATLAVLAAAAPASPQPPVFATNWQANEDNVIIEGIQRAHTTSINYFDGSNNRTALTNATGTMYDVVVTLYNDDLEDAREYYIRTYGGARHCQFWCAPSTPVVCDNFDSLCSYDYKRKATYVGDDTINGIETHRFFWTENLGPIPMNSLLLYVDANAAEPTPVRMYRDLHPFGKPLGNSTIDFTNFKSVESFDESIFDLGPDAKYDCASPEPGAQCQSEEVLLLRQRMAMLSASRMSFMRN